jgi:SAM-dependent methyltransferase
MPDSPSAEHWNRRYAGGELVWSATPNRFVEKVLADAEPGRALDLAAGEGRNAVWLAERGWAVTAVDFSSVGLDKGRRLADAGGVTVDWVCADLAEWTPPAGAFDAVIIAYLHVGAPLLHQVITAAEVALAPGGRLVVVGHHPDNLTAGWGGPQDPALLYTAEEVAASAPSLQIELAEAVERPVDTAEGPRVAIDALLVARRPS